MRSFEIHPLDFARCAQGQICRDEKNIRAISVHPGDDFKQRRVFTDHIVISRLPVPPPLLLADYVASLDRPFLPSARL